MNGEVVSFTELHKLVGIHITSLLLYTKVIYNVVQSPVLASDLLLAYFNIFCSCLFKILHHFQEGSSSSCTSSIHLHVLHFDVIARVNQYGYTKQMVLQATTFRSSLSVVRR